MSLLLLSQQVYPGAGGAAHPIKGSGPPAVAGSTQSYHEAIVRALAAAAMTAAELKGRLRALELLAAGKLRPRAEHVRR